LFFISFPFLISCRQSWSHEKLSKLSKQSTGNTASAEVSTMASPSFFPPSRFPLMLSCFQAVKPMAETEQRFLHSQSSKCSWFSVNYEETIYSTWLFLQKSWLYLSDYDKDLFSNPLFILTLQDTAVISHSFMFSVWGGNMKRLPGL